MSLFSDLRRLYRTERYLVEDPHTEIVAQVLRNSDALTLAWLKWLKVTSLDQPQVEITTQERFEILPGHSSASRPDITIRLNAGGNTELIFIESKVPSTQGEDQLQRYAEHLASEYKNKGLSKASLVFITRDYEAAEKPVVENSPFQPEFIPTRWFEFYRYLKVHLNGDGLATQLKLFMEENRMSLGNQFRSTDLVALENFVGAKALMDETLDGEVLQAASRIIGKVSFSKVLEELREDPRYVIHHGNWKGDFDVLIGYWLSHENPDLPVWVGVTIYSNPWSPCRMEVIEAFRVWVAGEGFQWKADGLDQEKKWTTLHHGKALQGLMGEPDHICAIRNHFLALLKDIQAFRRAFPKLPWPSPPEANG